MQGKSNAWLQVHFPLPDLGTYDQVVFFPEDAKLSEHEIDELFRSGGSTALCVEGDLEVLGELTIESQHAVRVKGDLRSHSLFLGEARLSAEALVVRDWVHLAQSEALARGRIALGTLDTPLLVSAHGAELAIGTRLDRFCLDALPDILMRRYLPSGFSTILAELEAGEVIDQAWLDAHVDLVDPHHA